jgi:hypothetical protein
MNSNTCPICQADYKEGFQQGEYVDVAVGWQQVSPDFCHRCSYQQPSPYTFDEETDFTPSQIHKLWQLQIPTTRFWEYWLKDDEP